VTEPFLVPIHQLRLPPNIPAGLNPLRLLAIADTLRNGCGRTDPIVVTPLDGGDYLVRDGRHRTLAHWIAGQTHALCVRDMCDLSEQERLGLELEQQRARQRR
jgi:hypothetical protein